MQLALMKWLTVNSTWPPI